MVFVGGSHAQRGVANLDEAKLAQSCRQQCAHKNARWSNIITALRESIHLQKVTSGIKVQPAIQICGNPRPLLLFTSMP